jgi:Spx/MgsR family transcriptional regulator
VSVTVYGIKNCDTMKKARTWLDSHSIDYAFHDYKVSGVERSKLEAWCHKAGWEKVLNRSGTTFRKLSDVQRADLTEAKAIELMIAQPSMIKRPVLELDAMLLVGFSSETYEQVLARS